MQTIGSIHAREQLSDGALIEQVLSGDQAAFEVLVHRYEMELYRFALRCLRDYEQAKDVVQFVFLQLYSFLPRLQGNLCSTRSKTPLKSWLFQVAVNRCRQEVRKHHPLCFSDLEWSIDEDDDTFWPDLPDPKPVPEELVEQRELQDSLYAAILTLPARPRSVVLLRYTEELSFGEIGRRLNMPENTAKSHFHRACFHLRAMLADDALQIQIKTKSPSA